MIDWIKKQSTTAKIVLGIILVASFFMIWVNQSIIISVCCMMDVVLLAIVIDKVVHVRQNNEDEKYRIKAIVCFLIWLVTICIISYTILKLSVDVIVRKYLFFLFSVPTLAVPAVFIPDDRKKCGIWSYGLLYFSFCLFFLGIMPIGSVPDEAMHSFTAYRLSNYILGEEMRADGTIAMREQDIDYQMYPYVNADTYTAFLMNLESNQNNNDIYYIELPCVEGSDYAYVIPAVGITIGRLFQVNTETMYLIARIFNLIFSTIGVMYILNRIPVGKSILSGLLLTPVMMQQMSSISYDIPVNLSLLFCITFTLMWFYRKEDITRLDWLLLLLSFYIGIQAKSHAYFLIAMLPMVMYIGRILFDHRKVGLVTILITSVGVGLVFLVLNKLPQVTLTADDPYSLLFLIQNPKEIARIVIRTVNTYGVWLVFSVLGNYLSYLNVVVHPLLIICIGLILVLNMLNSSTKISEILKKSDKYVLIIVSVLEAIIVCVGMLFANSHYGDHMVLGLQGRYFFSMVLMLGLTVPSLQRIRMNQKYIILCQSFVMLLVFVNIVNVY